MEQDEQEFQNVLHNIVQEQIQYIKDKAKSSQNSLTFTKPTQNLENSDSESDIDIWFQRSQPKQQKQSVNPLYFDKKTLTQPQTYENKTTKNQQVEILPNPKQASKERKEQLNKQNKWFNMPETQMTDELKRDLRLLRLRNFMDPKRFYKRPDKGPFSKLMQFGTVVEGAQDFYSGRISKRNRRQNITQEILADPHITKHRQHQYKKMQDEKQYWANKKFKAKEKAKKRGKLRDKAHPKKSKH